MDSRPREERDYSEFYEKLMSRLPLHFFSMLLTSLYKTTKAQAKLLNQEKSPKPFSPMDTDWSLKRQQKRVNVTRDFSSYYLRIHY
ncbi:hypothetical protein OXX79_007491 [Metschnikowia pulcherrima]